MIIQELGEASDCAWLQTCGSYCVFVLTFIYLCPHTASILRQKKQTNYLNFFFCNPLDCPLTFWNGTLGNNQKGFVSPPPPDGVTIWLHGGIYSNRVGSGEVGDCCDTILLKPHTLLTPRDTGPIDSLDQDNAPNNFPWIELLFTLVYFKYQNARTSSAWYHLIASDFKICTWMFPNRRFGSFVFFLQFG